MDGVVGGGWRRSGEEVGRVNGYGYGSDLARSRNGERLRARKDHAGGHHQCSSTRTAIGLRLVVQLRWPFLVITLDNSLLPHIRHHSRVWEEYVNLAILSSSATLPLEHLSKCCTRLRCSLLQLLLLLLFRPPSRYLLSLPSPNLIRFLFILSTAFRLLRPHLAPTSSSIPAPPLRALHTPNYSSHFISRSSFWPPYPSLSPSLSLCALTSIAHAPGCLASASRRALPSFHPWCRPKHRPRHRRTP